MVVVNRRRTRPKKLLISCVMLLCALACIAHSLMRQNCEESYRNLHKKLRPDDASCYYEAEELPSELETPIKNDSIFLISASCENSLNFLESCAIESVIRAHNLKLVYVLLTRPVQECPCREGLLAGLKSSPKIQFVFIKIDRFVENTPLANIFSKKFIYTGRQRHRRIMEVLKLATLYKYGGVVLDTNMIMAKSVDFLGQNWFVRQASDQYGSAAISLKMNTTFGRGIVELAIAKIKEQREQEELSGGVALTQAFQRICNSDSFKQGGSIKKDCANAGLYDTKLFYPLNRTTTRMLELQPISYGYYIWDTREFYRNWRLYTNITQEYCPDVKSFF